MLSSSIPLSGLKRANGSQKTGIIVPLYIYPEPSLQYTRKDALRNNDAAHHGCYDWHVLMECRRTCSDVPVIAIVNPDSGPGTQADNLLVKAFRQLKESGIILAGYVSTKYAGMLSTISLPQYPSSAIKNDVDRWYRFYPMIDGIFFDEVAKGFDTTVQDYYQLARDMARGHGARYVIMNPGTPVNQRWYRMRIADILITWEREGYPSIQEALTDAEYSQVPGGSEVQRGCLVIGEKYQNHAVKWILKPNFNWIYVTPLRLDPNPWNRIDNRTLKRLFKACAGRSGLFRRD